MSVIGSIHELVTARVGSRPLGVARAFLGVGLLLSALEVTILLGFWIYSPVKLRIPYSGVVPSFPEILFLPFVILLFLSALGFMIGFRTRAAGTLSVLLMSYILLLDQQFFSNHLYLVFVLCLLFTIADSGAAFSVDARRGHGATEVARWSVVLVKITLTVVYVFAVISKLNPVFLGGVPYGRFLLRNSLISIPESWRSPELMVVLALATILMEAVLVVGLWSRQYRPWAFLVGFLLHASIPLIMPRVPLSLLAFSTIGVCMLAPYLLFLDAMPASRVVIVEDSRNGLGWFMKIQRLDWLGVHQFLRRTGPALQRDGSLGRAEDGLRVLHSGVSVSGFDAVRHVLEVLPASFLWAPAFRLLPLRWLGEQAYRLTVVRS